MDRTIRAGITVSKWDWGRGWVGDRARWSASLYLDALVCAKARGWAYAGAAPAGPLEVTDLGSKVLLVQTVTLFERKA